MKFNFPLSMFLVFALLIPSIVRAEGIPRSAENLREARKKFVEKSVEDLEKLKKTSPEEYKRALARLGGKTENAGAIAKLPVAEREKLQKAQERMENADKSGDPAEIKAAKREYFDTLLNVGEAKKGVSVGELMGVGVASPKELMARTQNIFSVSREGKSGGTEYVPEANVSGRPLTHVTAESLKNQLDAALELVPKKGQETVLAANHLKEAIDHLSKSGKTGVEANVFEALNGTLKKATDRLKEVKEGPEREALLRDLDAVLIRPILQAARRSISPTEAGQGVLSIDALLRHKDLDGNPEMVKRVVKGLAAFARTYSEAEGKRLAELEKGLPDAVRSKVEDLLKAVETAKSPAQKLRATNELLDKLNEMTTEKDLSEADRTKLKQVLAKMNEDTIKDLAKFLEEKLGKKEGTEFACNCGGAGIGQATANAVCKTMGGTPNPNAPVTTPSLRRMGSPPSPNHSGAQPPAIAP